MTTNDEAVMEAQIPVTEATADDKPKRKRKPRSNYSTLPSAKKAAKGPKILLPAEVEDEATAIIEMAASGKPVNTTPNPAGRPRIEIDHSLFERMCKYGCSMRGIAYMMGVSEDTIQRFCKREYKKTFGELSADLREAGKNMLRMAQFDMALNGNTAMAIFLGKNLLDQSDGRRTIEVAVPDDQSDVARQVGEILDE